MESFFRRIRWSLIHHKNPSSGNHKETYGFKTSKTPDQQDELIPFETDMKKLLSDIEFKTNRNDFQKQLRKDVKEINFLI